MTILAGHGAAAHSCGLLNMLLDSASANTISDRAGTPALQDFTPLSRAPEPTQRPLGLYAAGRRRRKAFRRAVPVTTIKLTRPDPPLACVSFLVFLGVRFSRVVSGLDSGLIGAVDVGGGEGGEGAEC